MTSTEKQLIESVKKALYEESRKYSTAQERNLISIFHQALAEERKRVRENIKQEIKKNPNFVFYDLDKEEIGQDLLDVICKE